MREIPITIPYNNTTYTQQAKIGRGVNGQVYRYVADNRPALAVKFPSAALIESFQSHPEVLLSESKKEAAHNQLVYGTGAIYEWNPKVAGSFGIITRFFEGTTLATYFFRHHKNEPVYDSCAHIHHIAAIWLLAASSVLLLHSNFKLVHCDLKSDNFMLSPDKTQVFPIDFGKAVPQKTLTPQENLPKAGERRKSSHLPGNYVRNGTKPFCNDTSFDAHSMGDLLGLLYETHLTYVHSNELVDEMTPMQHKELHYVQSRLTAADPSDRFELQVGVCLVNNIFFSGINKAMPESHGVLALIFSNMVKTQCELLEREKSVNTRTASFNRKRKTRKIDGLNTLKHALLTCEGDLESFVKNHLKPALKNSVLTCGGGFFDTSRTESLLMIADKLVLSAGEKRKIYTTY